MDDGLAVVHEANAFLRHARFGGDQAELTTHTYAGHVALYLRWCIRTDREGRRADTGRRLDRVLAALAEGAKNGTDISVIVIACHVGVDRTFLYRHCDLLTQIHVQAAEPTTAPGGRSPAVSRASLKADLAAARAANRELVAQLNRTPPAGPEQRSAGTSGLHRFPP